MARVYVGGPSGSGKTAACKIVAQELGISYLTGSEIMTKAAGVSTPKELELLPENIKNNLRLNAFENYYKSAPDLVIDGHFYLTETDIRYFDSYLLVEIEPTRLIEFRKGDREIKQRSINSLSIQNEMAQLQERVEILESKFGIRVIRIKNDSTLNELTKSIEGAYISACTGETRRELYNRSSEIK